MRDQDRNILEAFAGALVFEGVSAAETELLALIGRKGNPTVAQLATHYARKTAFVLHRVEDLERFGFVRLAALETVGDGRGHNGAKGNGARTAELTEKGRGVLAKICGHAFELATAITVYESKRAKGKEAA
jgi:hypothetical protein